MTMPFDCVCHHATPRRWPPRRPCRSSTMPDITTRARHATVSRHTPHSGRPSRHATPPTPTRHVLVTTPRRHTGDGSAHAEARAARTQGRRPYKGLRQEVMYTRVKEPLIEKSATAFCRTMRQKRFRLFAVETVRDNSVKPRRWRRRARSSV